MKPSLVITASEASTNEMRKITMVGGLSLMTRTPSLAARYVGTSARPPRLTQHNMAVEDERNRAVRDRGYAAAIE
jgi:hypothetical protein